MAEIFISHSHADEKLAAEVHALIEAVSSNQIRVRRSSDKGEIQAGESWVDWIYDRVETSDLAIVMLTPSSFKGNWVLWEAGAVTGVQRAREGAGGDDGDAGGAEFFDRRVRPVRFGNVGRKLGPFSQIQVTNGLNKRDLQKFVKNVLTDFRGKGVEDRFIDDGIENLSEQVAAFLPKAEMAIRYAPIHKSEDLVQEWIARLDRNLERKEYEKVRTARRWINVAFLGMGSADKQEAIDFRIHMRLATGLSALQYWEGARAQLGLARQMSPRDMMVLRLLGRVEVELKKYDSALACLEEMEELDPSMFAKDEEAIALRYRLFADQQSWTDALASFDKAKDLTARSFYLANLRAVAALKVGGIEKAEPHFKEVLQAVQASGDRSIWARGTAVNAHLALGEADAAREVLDAINELHESKETLESLSRYYDAITEGRKKTDPSFDFSWRSVLRI